MANAIATVAELQARLDWVLDSGEQGVAEGALDDLSDDARYYGSESWDSETAPRQVKSLVLRAAARFVRNPDGYTQSRAGDETLAWADRGEEAGSAHFTSKEQRMLGDLAGKVDGGLHSVLLTAWGPVSPGKKVGYSPIDGAGYGGIPKEFPFFADDEGSI